MCLAVSNKRIYVQFVDDTNAVTLASVSTAAKAAKSGKSVKDATALGKKAAEAAKGKGIERIVFDRSGYKFHGRVKAIADAMREAGISFS
jgi:large subunit ribosomal protein L18